MEISRLGILATPSTVNSGVYESEIHKYNPNMNIFSHACPEWVNIVETNTMSESDKIEIVKSDLETLLKSKPEKIILGCTHYPYLTDILSRYVSKDIFVDPSEFFVEYIKSDLEKRGLVNPQNRKGTEDFYVSANPEGFKSASKMFYEVNNPILIK